MHHHRRRSGHGHGSTSTTDVRKSTASSDSSSKSKRPSTTRRHTPSSATKSGRSHHERENEEDEDSCYSEREFFPQFCAVCETQFSSPKRNLYCSDKCRQLDANAVPSRPRKFSVTEQSSYYSTLHTEPPDIVRRASPSRPLSSTRRPSPPRHPSDWPSYSRGAAISPSGPSRQSGTYRSSAYDTHDTSYQYTSGDTTYDTSTYDTGSTGLDRPAPPRQSGSGSKSKSVDLLTRVLRR
ncbi:hypothetical protein E4U09_002435 [Claviceps aff. purpurea]|uniref:Life-span regulatory factor domain-containing protein n=1 Tax=Claviceps aff. purpurea TaxID=1967640 RepID=A0A9P7QFT4_9HYPO|nr:hypothetical protein E4U09_002435 [Claviceps aff. purpurea]